MNTVRANIHPGERWYNGMSLYQVIAADSETALLFRPKDGWTFRAHHPYLFAGCDGKVQLLWAYSTDGLFRDDLMECAGHDTFTAAENARKEYGYEVCAG